MPSQCTNEPKRRCLVSPLRCLLFLVAFVLDGMHSQMGNSSGHVSSFSQVIVIPLVGTGLGTPLGNDDEGAAVGSKLGTGTAVVDFVGAGSVGIDAGADTGPAVGSVSVAVA
mmetsp:Transcript_14082/g.18741  ORF Transcript_14082/g.18741 Transcript_14082/m.18741 type:complete len:112 (-) Transcript_14082:1569-1904(-)